MKQAVLSIEEEWFTIASAKSLRLMAVGIGRNKKVRERASKMALAVAFEAMKKTARSPSGCGVKRECS